jgi:hypothetical protein
MAVKRGFSDKKTVSTYPTKMNIKKMQNVNFAKLLSQKQIGPNGRSAEWLKLAQSEEMVSTLEQKGSSEYFKKLKEKLAEKGFYREFVK